MYRNSPPWPAKERTLALEQARDDCWLMVASDMLEVPRPEEWPGPAEPVSLEVRAVLEDRLGQAGLDVFAPRREVAGGTPADEDPLF